MGKGYKHGTSGGANPLNFTVKSFPSEVELNASTASENTIGVVTTNPITGWHFTSVQPENMADGEVWFKTGTNSSVKFNAVKKNNVTVYPLGAKQMVSGELKDVTAKSYQNGEWKNWFTYLFTNGNQFVDLTGGWGSSGYQINTYAEVSAVVGNTLKMVTEKMGACICGTTNVVDVTNAKYVVVNVLNISATGYKNLGVNKTKLLDNNDGAFRNITAVGENRLSVENLSGEYYISMNTIDSGTMEVSEVWLE